MKVRIPLYFSHANEVGKANYHTYQRAKKVVSESPGLVDFAIGPVNAVLNLPKGQVKFLGKFILQKNCNQCGSSNFWGRGRGGGGYLKDSWAFFTPCI